MKQTKDVMIRVSEGLHARVKAYAEKHSLKMEDVLARALDRLDEAEFYDQLNRDLAPLESDAATRTEYDRDTRGWQQMRNDPEHEGEWTGVAPGRASVPA